MIVEDLDIEKLAEELTSAVNSIFEPLDELTFHTSKIAEALGGDPEEKPPILYQLEQLHYWSTKIELSLKKIAMTFYGDVDRSFPLLTVLERIAVSLERLSGSDQDRWTTTSTNSESNMANSSLSSKETSQGSKKQSSPLN